MKKCWRCGAKLEGDEIFCPVCGMKLKRESKAKFFLIGGILIGVVLGAVLITSGMLLENKSAKIGGWVETEVKNLAETEEIQKESTNETEKVQAESKKNPESSEQTESMRQTESSRQTESLPQTESLQQTENYEQSEEMHQVLADDEVEEEVLRIRAIFTEQMEKCDGTYERMLLQDGYVAWFEEGELQTITTSPEVTSEDYERIFTYEDGKLIFAYFLDDGKENRLYYKDDNIFRWSYPEATQIQDNNFSNPDFVANGVYGRKVGYELYRLATGQ